MPFFINLLQPAKCPPDVDVVFFFIYIFPAQGKQFTQTNSGTDCKGYPIGMKFIKTAYSFL